MHILILDDREDGRYLLEALLRGHGHQVTCLNHGAAALEALRTTRFDLIISDILMPVMDGFQFCQKLRADPNCQAIPLIFYTATYTGPQDEEFALRIGADRFLRKPCEPDELMAVIGEVVAAARQRTTPPAPPLPEEEVLRLYSERLVRKLEQKMLEAERDARALQEEKLKFQGLIEELPLGIALLDAQDGIRYLNPRFTDLFGYTLADLPSFDTLLHRSFPDLRAREDARAWWATARRDLAPSQGIGTTTFEIVDRSGHTKQVRIKPARLGTGERMVIFEDVTEQLRLETKLRQAQKMEAIATLAGGIAHDFNNILTGILGFAELAAREIPAGSSPAQRLEAVLQAAHRAKELVGHILAFSRQSEQKRIPLNLHLVVQEVLALLRSALPATIEIRHSLEREGTVLADPTQMHQVLMNLCMNAFHAMQGKPSGLLEIGLRRVDLSPEQARLLPGLREGPHMVLSVSDTGCGMTPEILARIYDPYFTTKQEGEGTGLGLSVTHGIVQSHHGAIDVTSTPGVGTTFRIYLPIITEASPVVEAQTPIGDLPAGQERILFLDDEPPLVTLGESMLRTLGYQVEKFTEPLPALDRIRQDPAAFDLVVTDFYMPRLNGLDLARQIGQIRRDLPIIICSGTASPEFDKAAAEDQLSLVFLAKPYALRDLAEAVRRTLDLRQVPLS
ncbi:MAG: multi-sensor hybrid histidine kinase [Candidatus Ozemobacter sibiricus]|jgi:PAS domain S-box-containing protein|uniref:histidine kinase n=1 Tax=Candidatus Ozemobacter sibiricus TaxID=2268124 RepID=A0A367ZJW5_9BACT|nr:MAG: multi-sensor hybrid histidine kinase [Candidatus Ozemobacter sibiricus]